MFCDINTACKIIELLLDLSGILGSNRLGIWIEYHREWRILTFNSRSQNAKKIICKIEQSFYQPSSALEAFNTLKSKPQCNRHMNASYVFHKPWKRKSYSTSFCVYTFNDMTLKSVYFPFNTKNHAPVVEKGKWLDTWKKEKKIILYVLSNLSSPFLFTLFTYFLFHVLAIDPAITVKQAYK